MQENAFIGKTTKPTRTELAAALGSASVVWDRLLAELAAEHEVNTQEWKCYSPKWGWSLQAKRGKRTIIWLSPRTGSFEALFIFGGKAMSALHQCRLSKWVVQALNEAKKYPEGTGVRLGVRSLRQLSALKKLAAIKLAN